MFLFVCCLCRFRQRLQEYNVYKEQRMGRRDNNKECDFKELGCSAMLVQLLCWDIIHQQVVFFDGFLLLVLNFQSLFTNLRW